MYCLAGACLVVKEMAGVVTLRRKTVSLNGSRPLGFGYMCMNLVNTFIYRCECDCLGLWDNNDPKDRTFENGDVSKAFGLTKS